MSVVVGEGIGIYYNSASTYTPLSIGGAPSPVLSINMFQYLTDRLILGVQNTSDQPAQVRITRSLRGLGEEVLEEVALLPGETKYWYLEGVFIYTVYANNKVTIIYMPVIPGGVSR